MEGLTKETDLFKNIFPDYDTFKTWYTQCGLSDGVTDVPSIKTFKLIFYRFADSHVRFSNDSFKGQFAIDLYTNYKEFEATTAAIDTMMSLTANDISTDSSMIMNLANIPETESSTDTEVVNFIGTQQKTINKKGSLRISKDLLGAKRAYTVKSFLKKFEHLFVRIFSPYYVYLYKDEVEE